jgi:hypothetical protein
MQCSSEDSFALTLQSVAKVSSTYEFVDQDSVRASTVEPNQRHQRLVMHRGQQLDLQKHNAHDPLFLS